MNAKSYIFLGLSSLAQIGFSQPAVNQGEVIRLLNGRDLAAFQSAAPCFSMTNGLLRISGEQFGDLISKQSFTNYLLVAEWKWGDFVRGPAKKARNTGIWVHGGPRLKRIEGEFAWLNNKLRAIECQIQEGRSGGFVIFPGTSAVIGDQVIAPDSPRHVDLYDRAPWRDEPGFRSRNEVEKPTGEWNQYEILCNGDTIQLSVNGIPINKATRCDPWFGKILVEGGTAEAFFRRIDIFPLKEPAPVNSRVPPTSSTVEKNSTTPGAVAKKPADSSEPPQEPETGFTPLFNGRDLAGWKARTNGWTVKDGLLEVRLSAAEDGPEFSPIDWTGGPAHDFELRLRCRILQGGRLHLGYRVSTNTPAKSPRDHSYFTIVGRDPGQRGAILSAGDNKYPVLAKPGQRRTIRAGEARTPAPIEERVSSDAELAAAFARDDWNDVTIRAEGARITVTINGVTTADLIDEDSANRPAGGVIGFGGFRRGVPEVHAQFKDVRLKHLSPPTATLAPSFAATNQVAKAGAPKAATNRPVLHGSSYLNFKAIGLTQQRLPDEAHYSHARAYGDFFRRGVIDVFTAQPKYDDQNKDTPTRCTFWLRQPDESFKASPPSVLSGVGPIHPRKAVVADFNGDKRPDIFVAGHGYDKPPYPGERNKVVLSQPNGTFLSRDASPDVGFFHGVAAADLNADRHVDVIVVNNFDPESAFVLLNDGTGRFRREPRGRLPAAVAGKGYFTVELVDVNEDGKLDLCLGGHEFERGSSTLVAINPGKNDFSTAKVIVVPGVAGQGIVLDFAVTGKGSGRTLWVNRTSGPPNDYSSCVIQRVHWPSLESSLAFSRNPGEWVEWILPAVKDGRVIITTDSRKDGIEFALAP